MSSTGSPAFGKGAPPGVILRFVLLSDNRWSLHLFRSKSRPNRLYPYSQKSPPRAGFSLHPLPELLDCLGAGVRLVCGSPPSRESRLLRCQLPS